MLALKVFGGITKTDIPIEVPNDDTKLAELELIFNREHEFIKDTDFENEATELLARYMSELNETKINTLTEQLSKFEEDSEEYNEILSEINNYMNTE